MEIVTIVIFTHIVSVLVGGGGAVSSDWLFLSSLKNRTIDKSEFGLLKSMSYLVWIGIVMIIVTGSVLIYLKPEVLVRSSFQLKLLIFSIACINGLVLHVVHIPVLKSLAGKDFFKMIKKRHLRWMTVSGVISMVSWLSILFISITKLKDLPMNVVIFVYVGLLVVGYVFARLVFKMKEV